MLGLSLKGKPALREALGQAIIDKIQSRTESGKSIANRNFKKYSKMYKNSDDFKAAGKSNKVNLTLTGDMLGLMNIIDDTENTVTIGWEDPDEAAKAHGHITGGGLLPKRDFFGLNNKDIASIKEEFKEEFDEVKSTRGENRDAALLSLINKVKESFNGEG